MKNGVCAIALTALGLFVVPVGASADNRLRAFGILQGKPAEQQQKDAEARAKALEHRLLLQRLRTLQAGDTRTATEKRQEALDQMQKLIRRHSQNTDAIIGNMR